MERFDGHSSDESHQRSQKKTQKKQSLRPRHVAPLPPRPALLPSAAPSSPRTSRRSPRDAPTACPRWSSSKRREVKERTRASSATETARVPGPTRILLRPSTTTPAPWGGPTSTRRPAARAGAPSGPSGAAPSTRGLGPASNAKVREKKKSFFFIFPLFLLFSLSSLSPHLNSTQLISFLLRPPLLAPRPLRRRDRRL